MREESVAMHRQGGLSSTEIVNVWQTRGVNIPSRTVRYWCSKLVQRPVGNPSVTTPEKFQARLDHSRDLTGDSPSKKIQKEALYQCGKEKFIAQGGNSLGWLKLREEQPISRWTAWRYSRDAELGQVSARARAPKRDEHGRSLRNPVAEFLQYDSLVHFHSLPDKEWSVHPSNNQKNLMMQKQNGKKQRSEPEKLTKQRRDGEKKRLKMQLAKLLSQSAPQLCNSQRLHLEIPLMLFAAICMGVGALHGTKKALQILGTSVKSVWRGGVLSVEMQLILKYIPLIVWPPNTTWSSKESHFCD